MLVTNQTTSDIYFGPLHLPAGVGEQLTVDDTSATSLYLLNDGVADALNNAYNSGKITVIGASDPFPRPTGNPTRFHGSGDPEGLVFAPQGSVYMRRDGVQTNGGVLYMKTTGVTFNTGWLDLATASGATAVLPPGVVMLFGGTAVPAGWLLADGSAVSRTIYSLLFSAIGTAYGSGDGSTTFNLPDLRGRVPVGLGTHPDVAALGDSDDVGGPVQNRRPAHQHTVGNPTIALNDPGHAHGISDPSHAHGATDPGHSHGVPLYTGGSGMDLITYSNLNTEYGYLTESTLASTTGVSIQPAVTGITIESHATGMTASASGGTVGPQTAAAMDEPSYLVVNYIIKT